MSEVIGVVHLPRLPSIATKSDVGVNEIIERALYEAKVLEEQGYDGVIIENYGDFPYKKRVKDPLTLSVITLVTAAVVNNTRFKVGVNVLRNSGREAYSIAVATGAKFIRVNSLTETIITDSGVIEAEAPRLRELVYNYPGVEIYADFLVKHAGDLYLASALGKLSFSREINSEDIIKDMIHDVVERGLASKIVLTGLRTGEPPDISYVRLIRKHSPVPLLIGSGINPENARSYLDLADGFIVGSYIRKQGGAGNPLDHERAFALLQILKRR